MAKKKARTPPNCQKITDEQCIEVVRRYVDEGESVTELAEAYGVSRTAIYNALHRAEFADRMKELREARLATAQLRILEQAEKALDRNEDILNTEYDPAYQYADGLSVMRSNGLKCSSEIETMYLRSWKSDARLKAETKSPKRLNATSTRRLSIWRRKCAADSVS